MDAVPKLVGIAGHVKGEELPLEYGKKVVVGRSRSADWSLVKLPSWTTKTKTEQDEDHAFRTVSGKHFEITMFNLGSIEVVNLSSNGTRLDGEPLDRQTITDISSKPHEIAFGADEVVRLELPGADAAGGAKAEESSAAKALDATLEKNRPEDAGGSDEDKPEKSEESEKAEDKEDGK